jgi:BirA family biotin operon repressor/biotin-[acetyl-CoA-carboxylase] ligase
MSTPEQFSPEPWDPVTIGRAQTGTRFYGVHRFSSIASTNTMLLEAAARGAREGMVCVADEQTAGRGRGGHAWHSTPGDGLYASFLIRPELPLREALWISLATGLAAQRAIRETTGLDIDIRWPNDLLLGGKKCGGILVETSVDGPTLRFAVIGIGINIHHVEFPPELVDLATSLRIESGVIQSREKLLAALLRALDLELTQLESDAPDLLERFAAASTWVRGKRVHVAEAGGYTGVTDGLDAHGFLQVVEDNGARHTVLSGGVREA